MALTAVRILHIRSVIASNFFNVFMDYQMGFIIEKAFQNGRKVLEEQGVRVESLAIIEDLSNCCIKIKDE